MEHSQRPSSRTMQSKLGSKLAYSVLQSSLERADKERKGHVTDVQLLQSLRKSGFQIGVLDFADLIRDETHPDGTIDYPSFVKKLSISPRSHARNASALTLSMTPRSAARYAAATEHQKEEEERFESGISTPMAPRPPSTPRRSPKIRSRSQLMSPRDASFRSPRPPSRSQSVASSHHREDMDEDEHEEDAQQHKTIVNAVAGEEGEKKIEERKSVVSIGATPREHHEGHTAQEDEGFNAFAEEIAEKRRKSVNPRMDESVRRIQKKLREKVYQRSYMLRRTFRALDEEHAGMISLDKFEDAVMKNFNLGEEDREALRKFVELIDADHSGSIDYDEFATYLKQNDGVVAEDVEQWEKLRFQRPGLGFMGMKKLVDELPLSVVEREDHPLGVMRQIPPFAVQGDSERMEALIAYNLEKKLEAVKQRFADFDLNHDGVVSREEFRLGMRKTDPLLAEWEIDTLFDEIDKNKSGAVNYEEFAEVMGLDMITAKGMRVSAVGRDMLTWREPTTPSAKPSPRKRIARSKDTRTSYLRRRMTQRIRETQPRGLGLPHSFPGQIRGTPVPSVTMTPGRRRTPSRSSSSAQLMVGSSPAPRISTPRLSSQDPHSKMLQFYGTQSRVFQMPEYRDLLRGRMALTPRR